MNLRVRTVGAIGVVLLVALALGASAAVFVEYFTSMQNLDPLHTTALVDTVAAEARL